jgi:hypothetical protein
MRIQCSSREERDSLIKRIFFLAYNASDVMGMGFLQARPNMTEDQVISNILNRGDYSSGPGVVFAGEANTLYADYVFGRMMKTRVAYDGNAVVIDHNPTDKPKLDYQSWGHKYKTWGSLVDAAMKQLSISTTVSV